MPITDELMRAVQQERRERIATAVLAGLVSNPGREGHIADYARDACRYADTLITELDKEPSR